MAPEDGHDAGEANQNTVFIDTSLDTHLATIVSDSDTVSDLKKRIMLEHRQCFPAIGDIEIHCLKVKRRGNYYHLSDSMLVKSAFGSSKKIWFLSLDASRLQQCDGLHRMDKHKARDQLALPWVTDSRSTDRHDSHSDRLLTLSFVHGSPSMQPKMIPFVNKKVPSVDQFTSGDSCKDVSKNIEEDKSSNDNHCRKQQLESIVEEKLYTVDKEKKSKKRTPDVHNESLREDAIGSGPSVKKKHKTQKTASNVKASEEDWVLQNDTVANALNDEHTRNMAVGEKKVNRVNEVENPSAHDQVATVVPSTIEDVAEATHPQKNTETGEVMHDTAMVVEKNIPIEMPFGMSQKDKENELVQKEVLGKIPSSLMRTSDCDHEAPGVTAVGPRKGAKRSTRHKAVEKELPSTPSIEKLHNSNKDVVDYSQQDFRSHDQEFTGNQIDKCKETTTVCENTVASKTRKSKKSTAKNKDKLLTKDAENLLDGISLTVPSPAVDEKIVDEGKNDKVSLRNEVLEKTLVDNSLLYESKKGDDLVVKDVENSEPTESNRSWVRVEDMEENASKKLKDNLESRRKKKDAGRSASRNEGKDTNEEKLLPRAECKEIPEKTLKDAFHAENSEPTESTRSRMHVEDMEENASKKLKAKVESRRRKKDVGRSTSRNEDSVVRHRNKENLLPRLESKESPEKTLKDAFPAENSVPNESNRSRVHVEDMEEDASKKLKDNLESRQNKKDVGRSTLRNDESIARHTNEENLLPHSESKESPEKTLKDALHVDHGRNDANLVDGAVEITKTEKNISQGNAEGCKDNSEELQNENKNGTKKSKRKKKIKKSSVENEAETITRHALDDHLHENAKEGEGSLPDANRKSVTKEKLDDVSEVGVGSDGDKPKGKDEQSFDDGLVKKVKNHKSSVRGRSDLPSKHPSTEVELESKSIELHPLHEESLKNTVSEVSKAKMERRDDVNNEVDTQKDDSHDIDFMNYFIPNKIASTDKVKDTTLSVREKKPKKKTKEIQPPVETSSDPRKKLVSSDNKVNKEQDDSMNENNKVLFSKNKIPKVSADVVKDPNIPNTDQVKAQKIVKKIDAPKPSKLSSSSSSSSGSFGRSFHKQKSNKLQPITVQARAKAMKKSAPVVNNSKHVQSLLNTGTIFGDDSDKSSADDNATADSSSSTRTPSGKSSSSSSGESPSIDSRRNESHGIKRKEGDGKNRANSWSRLKNISMADLLRSSSRFKKAKITASQRVEDTESEPVDFVPESQPIDNR